MAFGLLVDGEPCLIKFNSKSNLNESLSVKYKDGPDISGSFLKEVLNLKENFFFVRYFA
jgi:hypothetical protein